MLFYWKHIFLEGGTSFLFYSLLKKFFVEVGTSFVFHSLLIIYFLKGFFCIFFIENIFPRGWDFSCILFFLEGGTSFVETTMTGWDGKTHQHGISSGEIKNQRFSHLNKLNIKITTKKARFVNKGSLKLMRLLTFDEKSEKPTLMMTYLRSILIRTFFYSSFLSFLFFLCNLHPGVHERRTGMMTLTRTTKQSSKLIII